MTERYLYATKYHLYLLTIITLVLLGSLTYQYFLSHNEEVIIGFMITIPVLVSLIALTWLSYTGRLPLAKMKEKENGREEKA